MAAFTRGLLAARTSLMALDSASEKKFGPWKVSEQAKADDPSPPKLMLKFRLISTPSHEAPG